jgi:hypothetical protein
LSFVALEVNVTLSVLDDIPLYTSVDQITERLRFHPEIEIPDENLASIVAKYELAADRAHWAECGWNGCGTAHRFGFVISDKQGRETMCGQDCAEKKGGVQFKEVIARHKAREEKVARQKVVGDLLKDKAEREAKARATEKAVRQAVQEFNVFANHFRPIWRHLQDAARVGGSVWAEIKRSDWSATQVSTDRQVVFRIAGCKAVSSDGSGLRAALQLALGWYENELNEDALMLMKDNELTAVVRSADRYAEKVTQGAEYAANVDSLLAPSNVQGFHAIVDNALRPSAMASARQAIDSWPKVYEKLMGKRLVTVACALNQ